MKSIVVFSLMLFAVNLVQGSPSTLQSSDLSFLQSLEDEPDTPTNSTALEDIMKDLGADMKRRVKRSSCYIAGPYGGGGGGAFNDFIDNCNAVVVRIAIRSGSLVDAIQVTYKLSNGQEHTAGHHGGGGGGLNYIHLNVNGGERINGIFGKSGALVDQIGFITNHGRIFGPYGGHGGGPFHVNSCNLRGILGRSGALLDSIGFFCKP